MAVRSQQPKPTNSTELQMLSFYHFEQLKDPLASRDGLFDSLKEIPGLRGTIYLALEGINAQIAVPPGQSLDDLLHVCATELPFNPFFDNPPNLGDIVPITMPTFNRLIIRTRDFVLRDGIPLDIELDWTDAGLELSPEQWHEELKRQEEYDNDSKSATLLDCRNDYESNQGTFEGATPLGTKIFQDSWDVLDDMTKDLPRDEPVRIFCTGGIRCVKVGAYLKQHLGFSKVERLQHGIIGYQQWYQQQQQQNHDEESSPSSPPSAWTGENFLFDKREFADNDESSTSK